VIKFRWLHEEVLIRMQKSRLQPSHQAFNSVHTSVCETERAGSKNSLFEGPTVFEPQKFSSLVINANI
jgi:hypothetical protein